MFVKTKTCWTTLNKQKEKKDAVLNGIVKLLDFSLEDFYEVWGKYIF